MKKRLLLVLAVILSFTMVFAACGNSSSGNSGSAPAAPPASTDSSDTPAASTDNTSGESYNIDVAVTLGEPVSPNWANVINEINDRSGGRFSPTFYWSGSLISIPEIPKGMQTGAATFANLPSPNYPDVLPLNTRILQMPFMDLKDPEVSCEIYMQLYEEFPEMRAEMEQFNMHVLGCTPLGTYGLHFTDKNPVHLPEDLNGRKVVPYSVTFLPLFEENNAAGSYIPPGQIYESLEKGVVGGYINNWAFQGWFALTDLVSQHVNFTEYGAFQEFNILLVDKKWFDALSPEDQQLWKDVVWNEGGYKKMWQDTKDLVANEVEKAKAKDDLIIDLTDEEFDVWKQAVLPQQQIVLDEINAQRGDTVATDIFNRCKELIAEKMG